MQESNVVAIRGRHIDLIIVDDMELTPLKQRIEPKVGDTIAIAHEVKRGKDGECQGMKRADGNCKVTQIKRLYLGGTVGTGTGDVWEVKLASGKPQERGAKWVTVNPNAVARES